MDMLVTGLKREMHVLDRGKTVDFALETTAGECCLHMATALSLQLLRLLQQLTAAGVNMAAGYGEPLRVPRPLAQGITAESVQLLIPEGKGNPTIHFRGQDGSELQVGVTPATLLEMAEQMCRAAEFLRRED